MKNSNKARFIGIRKTAQVFILSTLTVMPALSTAASPPAYLDQGSQWTAANRKSFYSQDQGSQLIPLNWIQALKQANGTPFLADSLSRYGYLPNETQAGSGLPIGFTTNKNQLGMSCAACHVRQIEVENHVYRIDGGPAIVDFQSFAQDLQKAVATVLNEPKNFKDFAETVLGQAASPEQQTQLRADLEAWFLPYKTIMDNGLPHDKPWGPVRADAVGMIFNRVTGLDIGSGPDHIIAKNIKLADAPVRYPFIWNAPIQDKTQWPGFADNGNDLLGLARNLGEVYGVFAHFYPQQDQWRLLGVDFLQTNSANFDGLHHLESLVKKIGPPKWPWQTGNLAIKQSLANKGKHIFNSATENGGCVSCHGIRDGAPRSLEKTWATPLCNVNTDTRQFNLLNWRVDTGVLAGAQIPFLANQLKAENELAVNVLKLSVMGSILQHDSPVIIAIESKARHGIADIENLIGEAKAKKLQETLGDLRSKQDQLINKENQVLKGVFQSLPSGWENAASTNASCKNKFADQEPAIAFEAKVLQGIWATAPYFHNGSAPTLEDVLKPAAERTAAFKIGPHFDPVKVGLASEQTKFDFVYQTTDCSDKASGNSRCGHEFGVNLSAEDKAALLEYLKSL